MVKKLVEDPNCRRIEEYSLGCDALINPPHYLLKRPNRRDL
jgi:hypothetical protein